MENKNSVDVYSDIKPRLDKLLAEVKEIKEIAGATNANRDNQIFYWYVSNLFEYTEAVIYEIERESFEVLEELEVKLQKNKPVIGK